MSNVENSQQRVPIFDTALIWEAMIDSGYKDTPHALSELIDNSIQAGASEVNVYMFSTEVQLPQRKSEQVVKIAILDNGSGMNRETLKKSIGFGSGERLGAKSGLGKFGMGLSAASIAFSGETTVHSWQNGTDGALMTTLSTLRVKGGDHDCPEPVASSLDPDVMALAAAEIGRRGSLVVWEDLRISPKRFGALSANLEFLIGRIYRKFLHSGKVAIKVHDIVGGSPRKAVIIQPNDPLYLAAPSSTPDPYASQPMFIEYPDMVNPVRTVRGVSQRNGAAIEGEVRVRISHVKPKLRPEFKDKNKINPGDSGFGSHAKKNVGFSICREGRELMLDPGFARPSDPTERWWGVEIDFDASLDELFGVTTNKQTALAVGKFHHWSWRDEASPGETESGFFARCVEDGDPRAPLMMLFRDIEYALSPIRRNLEQEMKGTRTPQTKPTHEDSPEAIATARALERENDGHKGDAFNDVLPQADEIGEVAEEEQLQPDAREHLMEVLQAGGRFGIEIGHNENSSSFFLIKRKLGMLLVVINSAHPFYEKVWERIFEDPDDSDEAESIESRLSAARDALKLTLIAWARLEDESPRSAQFLIDARSDWGRLLRDFLADPAGIE